MFSEKKHYIRLHVQNESNYVQKTTIVSRMILSSYRSTSTTEKKKNKFLFSIENFKNQRTVTKNYQI